MPLRIAFYAPMKPPTHPVPSGDRRMARLLMAALRQGGHEVRLASRLRVHDAAGDARRLARLGARAQAIAPRLVRRWRDEDWRPDVWFSYHVYHKSPDLLGPAVARATGAAYVVAEASHAPKRRDGPWAEGHRLAAAAIAEARLVLCMTRLDMACVAPLVPPGHRLERLPPFIDIRPFAGAAGRRAAARRRLAADAGLDGARRWLLAVAMMRPGDKLASYRRLAAALQRLGGDDWQLVVAGDGPTRPAVAAALAALPAGRAVLAGELDEARLAELYAACDLFVWPGVGEAYGMAYLEAAASGLPAVAGRQRGVPDVVADSVGGVLVDPDDDAAFAAALRRLIDDPGERARLAAGAAATAAGEHGIEAAAARLDGWLTALVP